MVAKNRPKSTINSPLRGDSVARLPTMVKASSITAKYSGAPNFMPSAEMGIARNIRRTAAKVPAKNEPMAAVARAAFALPCLAIGYPSRHVIMEEPSPGMLTRMEVVEPP